jgi:acyl-coenzyme A thioesterase PaaI-like protein
MDERDREARYCFGCGGLNPQGLHLSFRFDGARAVAEFTPQHEHQGYPGHMHGGLVTTLLDEAMGWCIAFRGVWAVTGKMNVRFREPVPLLRPVSVSAFIERDRRRWLVVKSEVRSPEGEVLAEADALFMRVSGARREELAEIYLRRSAAEDYKGTGGTP